MLTFIKLENNRVTIESDLNDFSLAISELNKSGTKEFARSEAAKNGMPGAGLSGTGSPYPVDAEGKEVEHGDKRTIHRYRIDIPVSTTLR